VTGAVVIFESAERDPVIVAVKDGSRIVDVCEEHGAPVPFSCRSASCGTCRIAVLEGIDLLEPAMDEELDVLDTFGDDPARHRLACQARLRPGREGRLRVRVLE
jgi:2Fe-2S ferredoxin